MGRRAPPPGTEGSEPASYAAAQGAPSAPAVAPEPYALESRHFSEMRALNRVRRALSWLACRCLLQALNGAVCRRSVSFSRAWTGQEVCLALSCTPGRARLLSLGWASSRQALPRYEPTLFSE